MRQKFLDYLRFELNRAPLTIEAYGLDILQFQEWLSPFQPSSVDFSSVTANDVRAWLAFLAKNGDSPRTLRRKMISLRALFRWMMKMNFIKSSPIRDVPLPKISKPLPDLVKPDEIERAIESLENPDDDKSMEALIVDMLYSLGIRRAELIGLNESDIDFEKSEIKVTGKRSKQRVIPVPQKLMVKIRNFLSTRDDLKISDTHGVPLFIENGKRISPRKVYSIVHEALAESSARKKSPHALRHSFASGMLNGGAEIDSVREFLGHASLATTQIYTHISLNEIKKAYTSAHPRSAQNKK